MFTNSSLPPSAHRLSCSGGSSTVGVSPPGSVGSKGKDEKEGEKRFSRISLHCPGESTDGAELFDIGFVDDEVNAQSAVTLGSCENFNY